MHNNSGRNPTRGVPFHALPRHRRSRTTAIEPLMPAANHLVAERMDRGTVEGHPKVIDVTLNNRTHVTALIWDRLMPSSPKLRTDGLQLLQHPLAHRFPNHRELPLPCLSTTVRESKEVECLRLPLTASLLIVHCKSSELDQPRLLGVQLQSKFGQSFAKLFLKPLGFLLMLEPHNTVIGKPHDDDIPVCLLLSPLLGPKVERSGRV